MAAILLFALITLPIFYLYGKATLILIHAWFDGADDSQPGFVLTALVGLAVVSALASLLSLFMPLAQVALLITAAGALLILIWLLATRRMRLHASRLRMQLPTLVWVLVALVALSLLEQATHKPTNPDSGIYHAQTIRWAETYPAVPGLGNLHGRLAFNSIWLAAQALFSFAFLGLRSFHMLPAVLSALFLVYCLGGLLGWLRGSASPINILKTLLIPIFFYVMPSEISSPGTDLPVVLLVWFLAALWLEHPRRDGAPAGVYEVAAFILVLFALMIKLSAAPLLLLAAWVAFSMRRRPVMIARLALIALVLTIPWFIRSVIQSGYLVYPVAAVDLFDVDWKVPPAETRDESDAIIAHARLPREERSDVMRMPAGEWMPYWFGNLTTNRKLVLALAAFSPFLLVGVITLETLWRERFRIWNLRLLQIYLTALIGGLYWLFSAPDFRFGYGFLMLLVLIPLLLPLVWLSRAVSGRTHLLPYILLAGLILFQGAFLVRSFEGKTVAQRLLLPIDYPQLPTEPCPIKGRQVMCSAEISYNECWYDPFPCVPFARPQVELRGRDWADGFRNAAER